jgi:RNA polymerase sigma factor (sigma-70 family)
MTESQPELVDDVASLVALARAGNRRALDELVTIHLPLIYNIVGRALNGHADVDDLVQDTMLRVVRGLPELRDPQRFRSWAVAIAYRRLQQYQRERGRRPSGPYLLAGSRTAEPAQPADAWDVADPAADFADRTVCELVLSGQRREVAEAARWLDPGDRRLLSLWWQEAAGHLTRAELAAALDIPPAHAAVRLQRMKTRLDDARGVVRALAQTPRCPDLTGTLQSCDGTAVPLWRKRLVRHIRTCGRCGAHRQGLVAPEKLLLGLALVPVPAWLAGSGHLLTGHALTAVASAGTGAAAGTAAATGTATAGAGHVVAGRHGLGQLVDLARRATTRQLAVAATVGAVAMGGFTFARLDTPAPPAATPTPSTAGAASVPPSVTASAATADPAPTLVPGSTPSATVPVPGGVVTADLYVAPTGSDSADGSLTHPFATLAKAVSVVKPGQTVALRGGVYTPTGTITISTSGTAAQRILLSGYRDERPVIDGSRLPTDDWTVVVNASYWTVQGLEIRDSPGPAITCFSCRSDVFRRIALHDNRSGLIMRGDGTVGNSVLDSDFFDNHNLGGTNGTGLALVFGSGAGNLVRGCRTFRNAQEGIDLGQFTSPVTLEHNWSFGNDGKRWGATGRAVSGNGFTLGGGTMRTPVPHVLRDNAAWDNSGRGFNDERNPGALAFTGNTAFRNGSVGFFLPDAAAVLRGNVAVGNGRDIVRGSRAVSAGNTWDGGGRVTASLFVSADPATASGPRSPDGTLPRTRFLVTRTGQGSTMAE